MTLTRLNGGSERGNSLRLLLIGDRTDVSQRGMQSLSIVKRRQVVLATCGIRSPNEALENTQSRLLLLADSREEEYNRKPSPAHLYKVVTYTVHRILTCINRLTGLCLQSLHHRFVAGQNRTPPLSCWGRWQTLPGARPNSWQKTRSSLSNLSSSGDRCYVLPVPKRTGCSWFF